MDRRFDWPRARVAAALFVVAAVAALGSRLGAPAQTVIFAGIAVLIVGVALYGGAQTERQAAVVVEPAIPTDQEAHAIDSFDALLSALPVGIIVVNSDSRVAAFNATASEIFDVPAQRAVGRALIESVRSFEIDRRLLSVLRDGKESDTELTLRGPSERRLQVTIRALSGSRGDRAAFIAVLDRTRLRELEAIRRAFVSNVSHELRTPLASIKVMSETLLSGVDENTRHGFVSGIARETDRMIDLVEDLLDLARLESGNDALKAEEVALCSVCRDAVRAQEPRARRAGVTLEFVQPARPTTVFADRAKMYQVVSNLLDNAIKYTPPSGAVTVSVRQGATADVVVEDTGVGIPSAALPHVFERFFVADRSRAKTAGGTGLGLAIVKHIVEAHGGTIEVQSEVGNGTRLTCRLPYGQST